MTLPMLEHMLYHMHSCSLMHVSQVCCNGVTAVASPFPSCSPHSEEMVCIRCWAQVSMAILNAGKELEARLRQQHTKLNPKTSWAQVDKRKKSKKKRGFGDESSEE